MTVGELRDYLYGLNDNLPVVANANDDIYFEIESVRREKLTGLGHGDYRPVRTGESGFFAIVLKN
jgi:hypothetical protein